MDTLKGAEDPQDERGRDAYAAALGDRIRQVRGRMAREELAARLGLHVNTLGKFERGVSVPDAFTLVRLASELQVSAEWLLTGVETSTKVERSVYAVESGDYVYIPHFDVQFSAGNGAFGDLEKVVAMRPFALEFIRGELGIQHNELALVTIVGRSMEPVLHSKDTSLLDRKAREVSTEGLHAIRLDGGLMIKTLQRLPGKLLRASSANAEYLPFDIPLEEDSGRDFEVLGRVRWAGVVFQ